MHERILCVCVCEGVGSVCVCVCVRVCVCVWGGGVVMDVHACTSIVITLWEVLIAKVKMHSVDQIISYNRCVCVYCTFSDVLLTLSHVHVDQLRPLHTGGNNTMADNKLVSCTYTFTTCTTTSRIHCTVQYMYTSPGYMNVVTLKAGHPL